MWTRRIVGKFSIERLACAPADVDYASKSRFCDPILATAFRGKLSADSIDSS
jgi:hypothetical protein